jgi:tetratricopeptide (TPR) repeat protein
VGSSLRYAGVLLLLLGVAHADDVAGARDHYLKGTRAFDLGSYDESIREYSEAYRLKDDPALLYNIAQAHRLAGHDAEALRFYKMYLIKVPESGNRAEVELKIEELKKSLEQQKRTLSLPPSGPIPPSEPRPANQPPPASEPVPPPRALVDIATPAPPSEPPRRRWWLPGVATGVPGIALVLVGAAFSGLAVQAGNQLTDLSRARGTYDASKYRNGELDQTLGAVFLGVGAAACATGVALLIAKGIRR